MPPLLTRVKNGLWYESEEAEQRPNFLDGDFTKNVFDHFRNFTIAFAVGQAGIISWGLNVEGGAKLISRSFGAFFIVTALALFILNFLQGENLLQRRLKPTLAKKVLLAVYWSIYFATAFIGCFFNVIKVL